MATLSRDVVSFPSGVVAAFVSCILPIPTATDVKGEHTMTKSEGAAAETSGTVRVSW
jgi:hypothetical protein